MKRLVLLGGGHAHVEVLRRIGRAPMPDVELVLVSPQRFTAYSGMLPGLVAGHYRFEQAHLALEPIARFARARFELQRATAIDPRARRVVLADGRQLEFDVASIDIGSTPATAGTSGAAEHAMLVKPVETFLDRWRQLVERARSESSCRIVVVGGGAAGVETLLAMQYRLAREAARRDAARFHLLTDADRLLPDHAARVQAIFGRVLAERGVDVHLASRAVRVEPGVVIAKNGARVEGDAIVWATGGSAASWLRDSGLALDAAGFVAVNEHLQSISHPMVFAAGDCATLIGHPRPKSGVFAVRQGPPLAANLRAALAGRPLRRFVPQRHALALISTGNKYAVASRGRWALQGAWVWRWKDGLDRRFMRRYATLDRPA